MSDLIKRGLLMSLGTLALTQEKAEAIVDDLVHRGEARRDESSELVERLVGAQSIPKDDPRGNGARNE